jgi:hypothetical protein
LRLTVAGQFPTNQGLPQSRLAARIDDQRGKPLRIVFLQKVPAAQGGVRLARGAPGTRSRNSRSTPRVIGSPSLKQQMKGLVQRSNTFHAFTLRAVRSST